MVLCHGVVLCIGQLCLLFVVVIRLRDRIAAFVARLQAIEYGLATDGLAKHVSVGALKLVLVGLGKI